VPVKFHEQLQVCASSIIHLAISLTGNIFYGIIYLHTSQIRGNTEWMHAAMCVTNFNIIFVSDWFSLMS